MTVASTYGDKAMEWIEPVIAVVFFGVLAVLVARDDYRKRR